MSLSAIRNAVVSHLTASGPWAASEISTCTFGVLEAVSASAIVLQPGPSTEHGPLTMNGLTAPGAYSTVWGLRGKVYVKDNGDAQDVLGRCWQAHDDLVTCFDKADRLGGAQLIYLARLGFPEGNFESFGGALWACVDFELRAEEF